MTKEGAIKHRSIIEAFARGEEIYYYNRDTGEFRLTDKPLFSTESDYVIHNEFFDARKAQLLGEQIQFRFKGTEEWLDLLVPIIEADGYEYRVKPKEWYELEENVGKIILVGDTNDKNNAWLRYFKDYEKSEESPFATTAGSTWKYAWLIDPEELAKGIKQG